MAKKNSILGDIREALGEEGGGLIGDLLEQVTGSSEAASMGDELLENLAENGGGILEGIGDVVADLTGLGAANTKASEVAKLSGKTKSSSTSKKTVKSSAKKTTSSAKKTAAKKTATSAKKTEAKKPAAAKPKSSSTKKKTV